MNAALLASVIVATAAATILLPSSCKKPSSEAEIPPPNTGQVLARVIRTNTLSKKALSLLAQKAREVDHLTFSILTKEQAHQLMSLTIEHLNEDENKEGDAIDLLRFLQGNCSSGGRAQWRAWFAETHPDEIRWCIALRAPKQQ